MGTHIFTRPINYGKFKNDMESDANFSGIYIWGFINKGEFIPYYVGKSESSIYHRINNHFKKIHLINTYMIFKLEFYKNLKDNLKHLYDPMKPLAKPYRILKKSDQNESYLRGMLVYLNDEDFLIKYSDWVTESDKKTLKKELTSQDLDYKMMKGGKRNLVQPIINEVFTEKNLYISFTTYSKGDLEISQFKKNLKDLESAVKFNMPNPVISDSGKYKDAYIDSNEYSFNFRVNEHFFREF